MKTDLFVSALMWGAMLIYAPLVVTVGLFLLCIIISLAANDAGN